MMNSTKGPKLFFIILFLSSLLLLLFLLRQFLQVCFLAAISAILLLPGYRLISGVLIRVKAFVIHLFLRKRPKVVKSPERLAAVLTLLLFLLLLFTVGYFFVKALAEQAFLLYQKVSSPETLNYLSEILTRVEFLKSGEGYNRIFGQDRSLESILISATGNVAQFFYNQISAILSVTFQSIFYLVLYGIVTYTFLVYREEIYSFLLELSPLHDSYDQSILQSVKDTIIKIFLGNGTSSLIQGFAGGLIFYLFGLPSPLFWAILMSLLAFIPVVGILFIGIPAGVILILGGQLWRGLFLMALFLMVYFPVEWGLKSRLISGRGGEQAVASQGLYSFLTLLSILGGVVNFGILGIIYGPVILALFISFYEIYRSLYLET